MTLSSYVAESRVPLRQTHVRALAASGLSRRAFCRLHQLSSHALTYWMRKFRHALAAVSSPEDDGMSVTIFKLRGGVK